MNLETTTKKKLVKPKSNKSVKVYSKQSEIEEKIERIKAIVREQRQRENSKLRKTHKIQPETVISNISKKHHKKNIQSYKKDVMETPKKGNTPKQHIKAFLKSGIKYIESLDETDIEKILKVTNEAYRNDKPIITDNEYDIVFDYMKHKYPENHITKNIGAPIKGKNKVKLPYEMASMDKIKPETGAIKKYISKYQGPYVCSCKLDGVSGMYVTDRNGNGKLYTRGDGKTGQDVSHLIEVLNLPKHENYVVRGEFIIKKDVFDTKYKTKFANSRNLVSGIINRKSIDNKTADVDFVAYEVIDPPLKPSEQMAKLEDLKHTVVKHILRENITNEALSEILMDWRTNYEYEIDGVIVTNDEIYPRKSGNPDHSIAFKMVIGDQLAETRVLDVEWNVSKNGLLKPRIKIDPIQLRGVRIEYTSGFNGKFIHNNNIGIGAVLQIVRSGDVIPYVKKVVTPAQRPRMPDVPHIWDKNHVELLVENAHESSAVKSKNVETFFSNIDGIGPGNIKRIYEKGYDSISKILKMSVDDFLSIEGFKKKLAEKIHANIKDKIENADLLEIMDSSNKLGKGIARRKLKLMLDAFPNILQDEATDQEKIDKLKTISGIGRENATEFVKHIPLFMEFLKECGLEGKLDRISVEEIPKGDKDHRLYGKKVVMTKFRDKEISDRLKDIGAFEENSMKKDTYVLVVKSLEDVSSKTEYAKKHEIPIVSIDVFKEEYLK